MTVILILLVTIGLFVWGKLPPDVVALLSLIGLFLFGVINQEEALSGFSNPTVIMIAALFIIGEGLASTGWTALAGQQFIRLAGKSKKRLLLILTFGSGLLSGFVSNTGTVATLLPVAVSASWKMGTIPSKMLMPVAFGSNTGGLLTLTGTPPNIIVSNALVESGLAGFSFFEFTLIGLPLLLVAILYFQFLGYRLLPVHKKVIQPVDLDSEMANYLESYQIEDTLYRLRIRSMSPMINTDIGEWDLEDKYQISVVRVKKRRPDWLLGVPEFVEFPTQETELGYHDIITVRGSLESIHRLMIDLKLGLLPIESINKELKKDLISQEVGMAEMMITPRSALVDKKIAMGNYLKRLGIQLLAVSRGGKPLKNNGLVVKAGDSFIIRGTWGKIEALQNLYEHVVITGKPELLAKEVDQLTYKSWIALGALVLMILLLVLKLVPGAIAAIVSAGIILIARCIPLTKAYKSISFASVVMIAAMIPMGIALEKSGLAQATAEGLVNYLGSSNPLLLLGGIFVLTTAFSQTINNSATAILMAPIAILAATSLGISPKPFMVIVAISASTAFLTPVGTTTNAMVMSGGGYQFIDFVKVGAPLLLLYFIVSMILVPVIWPF